ncbi:MAG: hypothetical protein ACRD5H_14775 [Nitrososphaerales archaeon]
MRTQGRWDAVDIAMGEANSPQLFLNDGKIETIQVKAETVAIISCDSANFVEKAFSGAKNIIGLESGSGTDVGSSTHSRCYLFVGRHQSRGSGTDVGSSTHSMSRAGFAAAQQLINGKGPDAAVRAAIAPTANVKSTQMNWDRAKDDVGDKYVRIK